MQRCAGRRTGVFGGAFDPPHQAHRALLESAIAELALDCVHVVPTGQAWHKARVLTPAVHRLAMAERAFGHLRGVQVDAQETRRCGPSYTIDTLRSMLAAKPGAELFLIVGADQAAALTQWRAWQEIVQTAIICVADREDSSMASALFDAEKLFPGRFYHLKMPALTISATQIRATIATRQPVETLVSDAVARYIADHHLYQQI